MNFLVGILASFSDRVYGYDYFISYAHAGGDKYSIALKDALEAEGFRVFIDLEEFGVGANLPNETVRRIKMSSKLIVIGNEAAYNSQWVPREVETALSFSKPAILIDINSCFASIDVDIQLRQILSDQIHLAENTVDEKFSPSAHVLEELKRSFQIVRRDTKRQRFVVASISFVVLILLGLAVFYELNRRNEERKLVSQSHFLAQSSEELIGQDKPELAAKLAYEALPDPKIGRKRPLVGVAQRALFRALKRIKLKDKYATVIHRSGRRGDPFAGEIISAEFKSGKWTEFRKINIFSKRKDVIPVPLDNFGGAVLSSDGNYALFTYTDKVPLLYEFGSKGITPIGIKGNRTHSGSLVAFGDKLSLWAEDLSYTLWSLQDKKKLIDIPGAFGRRNGVQWSNNGKIIAVRRTLKDIAIIDGVLGKILFEISETDPALDDRFRGVASPNIFTHELSPAGRYLVTVMPGGIYLWDIEKRERIATLITPDVKVHVTEISFSSDGKRLGIGFDDGAFRVWDTSQPKLIFEDIPQQPPRKGASITASLMTSNFFFWGDEKGAMRVGGSNNGETFVFDHPFQHKDGVTVFSIDPNGKFFFSGGEDGIVTVFDQDNPKKVIKFAGHSGPVYDLIYDHEMQLLISMTDADLYVWDLKKIQTARIVNLPGGSTPTVVFPKDANTFYTYRKNRIGAFDSITGERLAVLEGHVKDVSGLVILPDDRLVSVAWDGTVRVWNQVDRTSKVLASLDDVLYAPVVDPVGKYIYVEMLDQRKKVVVSVEGKKTENFHETGNALDINFDQYGKYYITSATAEDTIIWDAKSSKLIHNFGKNAKVLFSKKEDEVLINSAHNRFDSYDVKNLKIIRSANINFSDDDDLHVLTSQSISRDNSLLFLGTYEGAIIRVDRKKNKKLKFKLGHTKVVRDMKLIQNERVLVTVSLDSTIKLWEAATGELIDTLIGHTGEIAQVYSANGDLQLITVASDETIRIWDIPDYRLENLISLYKKRISSPLDEKERCLFFLSDNSSC